MLVFIDSFVSTSNVQTFVSAVSSSRATMMRVLATYQSAWL